LRICVFAYFYIVFSLFFLERRKLICVFAMPRFGIFQQVFVFLYIYTNLIDILRDSIYNQDKREKIEGIENERHDQNFRYRRKIGHLAQYRIQSAEREIRSRKDQDRGAERRVGTRVQKFPQDARFVRGACE
jgi:hypothetical protein